MKQKLVESFQKDWKNVDYKPKKISLTEKNNHIILNEGKYEALAAYKLPIWRLGERNFNDRIYPKSLGEKVVKENKVTVVLDNHPADTDSPGIKEVIAVGKNPSIEGNILYAECYFVDKDISEKVERATDLGFLFEQSSSGYGELNEEGEVVTETYDLERYFDLLISDSSYNVSFGEENKISPKKEGLEMKEENKKSEETKPMKEENKLKTISKEDKIIKLSLENKIKEVSKIEDLKEKLKEYESVVEYFEDFENPEYAASLKEKVEKEIKELKLEIDALAEKGKQFDKVVEEKDSSLEETKKELKTLKEEKENLELKLEKAIKTMDESKEIYKTLKDLYENKVAEYNTMIDPDEYLKVVEERDKLAAELEEAKKDGKGSDSDKKDDEKGKEKQDGTGSHGKGEGSGKGKADGSGKKDKDPDMDGDDDSKEDHDEEDEEEKKEECDVPKKKKESSFKMVKRDQVIENKKEESSKDFEIVYEKKHPDLNIEKQADEIVDYYKDLYNRYGESIVDFKDSFLAVSTLVEAQSLYFKLRPILNERINIPSVSRRGLIDRTKGETRKSYNEKYNLEEKGSLERLKGDKGWI